MDDPFFAEDDGEFDDFYGNVSQTKRPSQAAMPRPSHSHPAPIQRTTPSLTYPDTPASSVASFMSKSTDGGLLSVTTATPGQTPMGNTIKKAKKPRRRRKSQELFQDVEWEKDADVSTCYVCTSDFSLLKRKHHCRHCGRVICSDCSSYWRFSAAHSKHRVCSYCNVELANGSGLHTMAASSAQGDRASVSQVETPTDPHAVQRRPTEQVTFYSDDADKLIVDEAPDYYDSVIRSQQKTAALTPGYAVSTSVSRPSVVAASSDNSSGTLIDAPEIAAAAAAAATAHPPNQTRRKSRSPEGKEGGRDFAGALKRFFGISKNKPTDAPAQTAPSTEAPAPAQTATTALTVAAAPSSVAASPSVVPIESPTEHVVPLEMPRPTFVVASKPASARHVEYDQNIDRDDDDHDGRYTMVDPDRFRAESQSSSVAFRHTMNGYLAPSSHAAESLVRASVVGASPGVERDEKKEKRRSTRGRRDTFGDLFDSPTKKSASSFAPSASVLASLPTRSWGREDARAPAAAVGVDRFDRPRHDEPDEDLTQDLGGAAGVRESNARTPWNAVGGYRSPAVGAAVKVPSNYYETRREASHYGDGYDAQETAVPSSGGYQYDHVREDEAPRKTIMDDLPQKPRTASPRGSVRQQKDSVDDFFADFEKPTDYVFDTNSGTYVPANASRRIYHDQLPRSSPRPTESRREKKPRASARRSEVIQVAVENESDGIDGIIVDKISTLEGELEALKQLLRKRGLHQPPPSPTRHRGPTSANRKQSIFDSDGSEKEEKLRPKKEKRRPSSRKAQGSESEEAVRKPRRKRKDSFADLFEEEDEDAQDAVSNGVLGARNYEALFQIGVSATEEAGGGSDDDRSDDKKLSRRQSKRRSQRVEQRSRVSDSGSSSDTKHESKGRFGKTPSSFQPRRRDEHHSDDSIGEKPVLESAIVAVDVAKSKLKKKDSIDALFDSENERDMDFLFDATAAVSASNAKNHAGDASHESDDEKTEATTFGDARAPLRRDSKKNERKEPVLKTVEVPAIIEAKGVSSDEEFSSTLKTLRNRRVSKTPVDKQVAFPSLPATSSDEADENEATLLKESLAIPSSYVDQHFTDTIAEDVTSSDDDAATDSAVATLFDEDREKLLNSTSGPMEETTVTNDRARPDSDDDPVTVEQATSAELVTMSQDTVVEHAGSPDDETDTGGFDPLALLDEEAEDDISATRRNDVVVTCAEVEAPVVEDQLWEPEFSLASSQMKKALRFRDSLLDSSSTEQLDRPPSLNLDELMSGPSVGFGDLYDHDASDANESSEDDDAFSFEIKPSKRASKTTTMQPEAANKTTNEIAATAAIEDEVVVLKIQSPRGGKETKSESGTFVEPQTRDDAVEVEDESGTASTALSLDGGDHAASDESSAQFQDDWQRLQEQEKERKKKLQMKQRQAQRDKLKRQSSSGRALGKAGNSSRAMVASEASSPTAASSKKSSKSDKKSSAGDPSENPKKKKKKHHKKTTGGGEDEVEGDGEAPSRRKSDKRRHRERDTDANAPTEAAPSSDSLTEL